jgi:hypothetical protein
MKHMQMVLLLAVSIFTVAAAGPGAKNPTVPTIASAMDREISDVEKEIVEAAEAMPEEKFNFSPESLNVPGADYHGVRTFALEVRRIAASNYAIWSPLPARSSRRTSWPRRSRELEEQSPNHRVPEGFFCRGSQSRGYVDYSEHVADPAEQQIAPPAFGSIRFRSRAGSLRTDGGKFADERHSAAGQPLIYARLGMSQ